jgi:alanine racemase
LFQGHQFNDLIEQLKAKGISFPLIHASNSAAILRYPEFHYNCVRPGILLYGIDPFLNQYDLHPILSLHSYVSSVKIVPEFSYISYCRTFQTQKETKIAIIPFGYADGYMWDLSNKTFVSIHGKLYPIIGNICMNQFVVDISNSDDVFIYDPVTLIEADNQSKIGLNQLAMSSEKIPYEILCRLSETIHRNYRLR